MLRAALLAFLASFPVSLLTIVIDGPADGTPRAGERVLFEGEVWAEGPLGPMPGAGVDVELETTGPGARWCELQPDEVALDPVEGNAKVSLSCEALVPGWANVTVTARSPTHGEDSWNVSLRVLPDLLDANVTLGAVEAFRVPIEVRAVPQHLASADVNVTLRADLEGTPLFVRQGPFALEAGEGNVLRGNLTAIHGPGTYELVVHVSGAHVEPVEILGAFVVPDPEPIDAIDLALQVTPAAPGLALADSTVNEDGRTKRPGEALITRFVVTDARTINVTVSRFVGEERVTLARDAVAVGPDGVAEHRFEPPVAPAGAVLVEGRVGDAIASRTGTISNVATTAHVTGPLTALADGRCLTFEVWLNDSNFGSTALDAGPLWGLPDVRWRTFRGSSAVQGWTSTLGPWNGTGEGTAGTSRVSWPQGTSWASVTDGQARTDLALIPPTTVAPGTYRVSVYDPSGVRLGGTSFALTAPPTTALSGGDAIPGLDLPVDVTFQNPVEGLLTEVRARIAGTEWNTTVTSASQVLVPVPDALAAGTIAHLEAWTTWPGRPAAVLPDAVLDLAVPALPPTLTVHATVDGVPFEPPLPVHPAGAHVVDVVVATSDPNGDAVEITARVAGPDGEEPGWPLTLGDSLRLEVPEGEPPGRYAMVVTATAPDGSASRSIDLDVATIARLSVEGAGAITMPRNGDAQATLTVTNRGTAQFVGLLLDVQGPVGLASALVHEGARYASNATIPLELAPGASTELTLELAGGTTAVGEHLVHVVVAGVLP